MVGTGSLSRRLAWMVSALVAGSILAVLAFAYYEIGVAADLAETARIQQTGQRIAALVQSQIPTRNATMRRYASMPEIRAAVISGKPSRVVDSLLRARRGADTALTVLLLDKNGKMVSGVGNVDAFGRDVPLELSLRASPNSGYQSPLILTNGKARTIVAYPVMNGSRREGLLVQARFIQASPTVLATINRYLVSNVNLYIRDRAGTGNWVDFSGKVYPPPANVDTAGDVVRYTRGNEVMLSSSADVTGSPFTIVAETPRAGAMKN